MTYSTVFFLSSGGMGLAGLTDQLCQQRLLCEMALMGTSHQANRQEHFKTGSVVKLFANVALQSPISFL
jgi:hypothetical protein